MEEFVSHIHFLRPMWLWLYVPLLVLSILLFLASKKEEQWRNSIAKDILPYLIIKGDRISALPKSVLILLLSIMILASAGPAWQKVEKPGGNIKAALVILLDASQSMLVSDIAPSRMERAKQKISDLLDAAPGSHVAVIAYAGSAHMVIPFTNDYKTINYLLESVSPKVMPVRGTNLEGAIALADSLLLKIEAPSTLLILSDDVSAKDIDVLNQRSSSKHGVEFMALATPSGGSIPIGKGRSLKDNAGAIVVPKLNIENLKKLSEIDNVNITTVTLDASDVKRLATNIKRNLIYSKDEEEIEEDWQDAGYWLLFPIALLVLFWFRRGWVVQWCILLLTSITFSSCTELNIEPLPENWKFVDLWWTRDQQGQMKYNEGDTAKALVLFENPWQKAKILDEQGQFGDAASIYSAIPTAEGYYNYGVIQAKLKNWKTAQKAFEMALEANPDFTNAQDNLTFVNAKIASILSRYGKITSKEDMNRPESYSEEKDELNELKDELESDEEQSNSGGAQKSEGDLNIGNQQNKDDLIAEDGMPQKQQEAKEMILRQLSDDPAIFMQRKFKHQVLTGKVKVNKTDTAW